MKIYLNPSAVAVAICAATLCISGAALAQKKAEKAEKAEKKGAIGFKPLKDRCFVSYTEELERTSGGIYIPDAAKEKPQRGKIEACGSEVKAVNVGDIVLFDKYSGSKINVEGTDYLIIKEEDILGIFDK